MIRFGLGKRSLDAGVIGLPLGSKAGYKEQGKDGNHCADQKKEASVKKIGGTSTFAAGGRRSALRGFGAGTAWLK
jgi:hypothetical protein